MIKIIALQKIEELRTELAKLNAVKCKSWTYLHDSVISALRVKYAPEKVNGTYIFQLPEDENKSAIIRVIDSQCSNYNQIVVIKSDEINFCAPVEGEPEEIFLVKMK